MNFTPALHGLRGLAALLVLLYHWDGSFPAFGNMLELIPFAGKIYFYIIELGWIGVDWFFVLSGFLLSANLWFEPINFKSAINFGIKRAARLYPGVWFHLFFLLLVLYFLGFHIELGFEKIFKNLILWVAPMPFGVLPINTVFWTLPLEMSFYLTLPLLVWSAKKFGILQVALFCLIITLGWRFGIVYLINDGRDGVNFYYLRHSLPGILFVFIAGFMLNYFVNDYHFFEKSIIKNQNLKLTIFFGLLVIYAAWLYVLVWRRSTALNTDWLMVIWELVVALIIASIILMLLKPIKGFGWLGSPILIWLGNISFGIYLWHFPIFRLLHRLYPGVFVTPIGSLAALAIGLVLSLLLAWLSYRLVERPAMKWASRI
jgi:peptidoglycan/LPS O-acetylase OafA/YrhL